MDLGLSDRVYLVTGASRGLGRASAQALAAEGACVVLASRSEEAVTTAAREVGEPERVVGVAADLGDPAAAQGLVDAAAQRFGRLDGALVSVGGPAPGGVMQASDDQWHAAFESVFLGAVRVVRAVAKACLDGGRGGSIALVLSSSVKQPIGGLAISNGLRPGLAMTAKTLADELGPQGVRVNALLPGRIDTDRVRELDSGSADPEAARAAAERTIPLRRYGRPEEFGRTAAFVLSPAAGYITGTTIAVDGGAIRTL
jgi:3-oxoacyl-[acyl-carrier protein] reductase